MIVFPERLVYLATEPRDLIFAAVQLAPPALEKVPQKKTLEWRPADREARIHDIKHLLDLLLPGTAYKKPDFIIFPEYSVPAEAFGAINFQRLSDQYNCALVCGTYFQADKALEYFGHNLCKIFLPHRGAPITLCKATAAPDESDYLLSSAALPNIARLVWHPAGKEEVSINLFLCRDYLQPYEARPSKPSDQNIDGFERVSLLEWGRPGINIAIMLNLKSALFEAAAAFDIRETRGKRKIVLLSNAYNRDDQLATALISASNDDDKLGDVAACLPSNIEGVLGFEACLWDTARTKTPDRRVYVPIKNWSAMRFDRSAIPASLVTVTRPSTLPRRRGIFHPALLESQLTQLVIELYVVRSVQRVDRAFELRHIRNVTASHVRGVEDVLIRRYVERYASGSDLPDLDIPYSYLSSDELDRALESASLKILVQPRDILKWRGVEINQADWDRVYQQITEAIDSSDLNEIIRVATGLEDGEKVPERLESVFCLGVEDVIPIGKAYGNQLRETCILVSTATKDGREATPQFRIYIRNFLMQDYRIRDIYQVNRVEPATHSNNSFRFVLRLKCTVFETDEIIDSMQQWAESNDEFRVWTRTYDTWRNISRDSVNGIIASKMTPEVRKLLGAIKAKDLAVLRTDYNGWLVFPGALQKVAVSLERHSETIKRLRRQCQTLGELYCFFCLANFASSDEKRETYLTECGHKWRDLFGNIELSCRLLLTKQLELPDDAKIEAIVAKLEQKIPERMRGFPEELRRYSIRLFQRVYKDIQPGADRLVTTVNNGLLEIQERRNLAIHGDNWWDWKRINILAADSWEDELREFDETVKVMCVIIASLNRELHKLRSRE
jgi:hypothetical protein